MSKTFKFDVILTKEDLCDREKEAKRLMALMQRQGRIVVYSPRRMGKTSLVRVVSQTYQQKNPGSLVFYIDLNEVSSLEETAARFRAHYEYSLREQLPIRKVKYLLSSILSHIKISIEGVDLTLDGFSKKHPEDYLLSLFHEMASLSQKCGVVLVIDEFQGICDLKDVQALLRRELKNLGGATVILMGSNQRLLYKMFNDKKAPFFSFGEDLELGPIPLEDYLPYMNERFAANDIHISKQAAQYFLQETNHIPNYTNELCAWIMDTHQHIELTMDIIAGELQNCAYSKQGRYESALYGYTFNQKQFIRAVARLGFVKNQTGQEMQQQTGFTSSELSRIKETLIDAPLLSLDAQNRLFVIDPFLRKFLELMN